MTAATSTRGRRIGIGIAIFVGAVLLLNLLARGLDRAAGGNTPGGSTGSSYATGSDGLGAYGVLLTRFDHHVSQQRDAFADDPPPPNTTVFVIEPTALTNQDTDALLQFVTAGGHLVIGGRDPFYVRNLRDHAPDWSPIGQPQWIEINPSLGGVSSIATASQGSWSTPGSGKVLIGNDDRSLLTVDQVGQGEIFFLADASPLENDYLGRADNATLGLALAGPGEHPVVFAEGVHGYGTSRGLSAIPTRWKWALLMLVLAILAFVWSRARRFGPPDRAARDLPPARAEYVRSLSITLERTHDRAGALAPVQVWSRDRLTAHAGLRPDASPEEIARAAKALGCSDAEVHALFAPAGNDADVLALGRALARINDGDRRLS